MFSLKMLAIYLLSIMTIGQRQLTLIRRARVPFDMNWHCENHIGSEARDLIRKLLRL